MIPVHSHAPDARLRAHSVTTGYDERTITHDLSVRIPDGGFTVIIGPNACGKSTLLKTLANLLPARSGHVTLDEADVRSFRGKELARRLGLLPQSSLAPDGITVAELVARGRFPHQTLMRQWRESDEEAVADALDATNTASLATRLVDELSGGQRQRVWVAMVLAQQTDIILLDEPTSFLDIAHQYELLDLCEELHRDHRRTLVAVLHDLNQAARYATNLIVMHEGRIVAEGSPSEILDADLIQRVFGLAGVIVPDPLTGTPMFVPQPRRPRDDGMKATTGAGEGTPQIVPRSDVTAMP